MSRQPAHTAGLPASNQRHMQGLSSLLNRPEYVHAATNHFPLVGLFVAMLVLVIALVARNRGATYIGLGLVALLALSVWPVYHYGQAGYDRVLSMTDEAGAAFLDHHKELGERWVFLYFVTAGVAALGLLLGFKWPRLLPWFCSATLLLGLGSLAAGVVIAQAGGEIRHREFRNGPPPEHHERS